MKSDTLNVKSAFYFQDGLHGDKRYDDYIVGIVRGLFDPTSELHAPNSEIYDKMKILRDLDEDSLKGMLPVFKVQAHDVLIGHLDNEIIGHSAFQEHSDDLFGRLDWRVYNLFILPDYRHNGYATELAQDLIRSAKEQGVEFVRFGKGINTSMNGVLDNLGKKDDSVSVGLDGWVRIN